MAYSSGSDVNTSNGFVELSPIYCPGVVAEACKLIRMEYRRPIDHAAQLAFGHVTGNIYKKKKKHKGLIHALIGEIWLYDMIVDWLKDEHGWEVDCPVTSRNK